MKRIKEWFNAPLTWKRYWAFYAIEALTIIVSCAIALACIAEIPQKAFGKVKTKIKNFFKKS